MFKKRLRQPQEECEFFFRHKDIFIDPFKMLEDPVFRECGFHKPYFCIAAQRVDEIIVTFKRGCNQNIFRKRIAVDNIFISY